MGGDESRSNDNLWKHFPVKPTHHKKERRACLVFKVGRAERLAPDVGERVTAAAV